jgi:hypothetical protein
MKLVYLEGNFGDDEQYHIARAIFIKVEPNTLSDKKIKLSYCYKLFNSIPWGCFDVAIDCNVCVV